MSQYRLMMLGPPGAGKGTQAKVLADQLGIPHVSTGDMLREARRKGTELGKKAEEYMNSGQLVPDEVVIGIVRERLEEKDAGVGFILDGFPRTRTQAEALDKMGITLDAVINIQVSDQVVVDRLSGRISCPECGAVYHRENNPPTTENVCDACGYEGLITRDDDKPEAIRERLSGYHNKTAPLIEYYQAKGILKNIEGVGTPTEVLESILSAIGA